MDLKNLFLAACFWISSIFVIYVYAGYPLLLWIYARAKRVRIVKSPVTPAVSVIIAAFNEEERIEKRISNILSQKYPMELLEVIVVSDGSFDNTAKIITSFSEGNVKLIELSENGGKAIALNRGVEEALGEIIVFADARQRFDLDAVAQLAANFADPTVGCVSGELFFTDDDAGTRMTEMGAYLRYEKWVRKMESATGSVVGAIGAIYAIRRKLFRPLPAGAILDDVLTPVNVVKSGFRCIFDKDAVAYDTVSKNIAQEWPRKVRTLAGNWQLMDFCPDLVLPGKSPFFWRFFSHKTARLLVPPALAACLVSALALPGPMYGFFAALQILFYGAALTGLLFPAARRFRPINISCFFMVMNAAAAFGFWVWLTGRSGSAWKTGSSAAA